MAHLINFVLCLQMTLVSSYAMKVLVLVVIFLSLGHRSNLENCNLPTVLRGTWFSWENGQNTINEINADTMTNRGRCVQLKNDYHVNYTVIFDNGKCFSCVKFLVRTVNILEKAECKYFYFLKI